MHDFFKTPTPRPVSPDASRCVTHIAIFLPLRDKDPVEAHKHLEPYYSEIIAGGEMFWERFPTFSKVVCADFARNCFQWAGQITDMERQNALRKLGCGAMRTYEKIRGGNYICPWAVQQHAEFSHLLEETSTAA